MTVEDKYILTPSDLIVSQKAKQQKNDVEQSVLLQNQLAVEKQRDTETEYLLPTDGVDKKNKKNKKKTKKEDTVPEKVPLSFWDRMTIVTMCSVNFFCFVNFSILAPIFPPAAMQKGMSQTTVGFVIGVYNLIMFIASPIVGVMLGRVGAKFMFVVGALFSAACAVLFGFVNYGPDGTIYTVMSFLTRGAQALGCAAFETASYAIIAYKFPDRVTTYFSFLETFAGLGLMTGPPIGGVLYEVGGYYLPFCVTGAALGLSGLIVLFTVSPVTEEKEAPQKNSICYYIARPGTALLLYTVFCDSFAVTFLEPTFANFLAQFHLETYQVGFVFLIIPALYAILGPIFGMIGDRKGYLMTMMIAGSLMSGVGYIFFAPPPFMQLQPTLWLVIGANVLVGMFIGAMYVPAFPALLVTALETGYKNNFDTSGMVSGVMLSAYAFGGFAGASSAGALVELIGFSWSAFVVACLFLVDAFLLIVYALVKGRNSDTGDIFDHKRTLEKYNAVKYVEI